MQKLKIDTSKLLTVFSPSGSPQSSAREVENFKERSFTNLKEVDRALLTNLSDKELFRECLEYDYVNSLCQDDDFWKDRFIHYFGEENCNKKPYGRKWKNHYLKISSDLDKFINDPWIFFSLIEWNCKDSVDKISFNLNNWQSQLSMNPKDYLNNWQSQLSMNPKDYLNKSQSKTIKEDGKNLLSSPEWIYNNFYFQNLGNHIILEFPLFMNVDDKSTASRNIVKEYNASLGSHFTPYHLLQLIRDFYIQDTSSIKFKGITKCENKFIVNIQSY